MGLECRCDLCGRRTTMGALQFWGDLGLCEFCDALASDHYEFDMALEERRPHQHSAASLSKFSAT